VVVLSEINGVFRLLRFLFPLFDPFLRSVECSVSSPLAPFVSEDLKLRVPPFFRSNLTQTLYFPPFFLILFFSSI